MASGENASPARLAIRHGHGNNPEIVIEHTATCQRSNSSKLHLPPILPPLKPGTGRSDQASMHKAPGNGLAVTANLSRRLSAPEPEIRTNLLHRFKDTEDHPKTRENNSLLRTKNRQSLCDDNEGGLEIDEEVKRQTELYRRRGRRYSLPVSRPHQPAKIHPSVHTAKHHQPEDCKSDRGASRVDSETSSPRRVENYKLLGRRYSLPPQILTSGQQNSAENILTEETASNSSRGLLDSSASTDDFFSCAGSMQSNLTPLDEDLDNTDPQIQRYLHRGRRYSLPPPNHFNSRYKSSNGTLTSHDQALRRVPTPVAAECPNLNGLYLKHSGFQTMKTSKSVESFSKVDLVPPNPCGDVGKDTPDLDADLPGKVPRGFRAKRDAPTGVTWETKPTHKTFSFTYNDTNNVSEMLSPPVTGGIVLKSLQADRPSESLSPEPTTDPTSVRNKDVESKWQSSRFISPTLQVLKDSWRRENNEEKTMRILRWIANEQAQRSNEDART